MEMYMVVMHLDTLAPNEYGVSKDDSIVGLWEDIKSAEKYRDNAQKELDMKRIEYEADGYTYFGTLEIIPVETNKYYLEENRPCVGGAFYIE